MLIKPLLFEKYVRLNLRYATQTNYIFHITRTPLVSVTSSPKPHESLRKYTCRKPGGYRFSAYHWCPCKLVYTYDHASFHHMQNATRIYKVHSPVPYTFNLTHGPSPWFARAQMSLPTMGYPNDCHTIFTVFFVHPYLGLRTAGIHLKFQQHLKQSEHLA